MDYILIRRKGHLDFEVIDLQHQLTKLSQEQADFNKSADIVKSAISELNGPKGITIKDIISDIIDNVDECRNMTDCGGFYYSSSGKKLPVGDLFLKGVCND